MCLVCPCSSPSTVKQNYSISLFPKEITVHSGIVWRDKIYGDRRQICERVEVSTIKFQLFKRPKMKYLLFNLNVCCHISCPSNMGFARLDSGLWEMASSIPARAVRYSCPGHPQSPNAWYVTVIYPQFFRRVWATNIDMDETFYVIWIPNF
jgi:hypothetical protein